MRWRLWHEKDNDTFVITDDEEIEAPADSRVMKVHEKPSKEQLDVLEKHGHDYVVIEKG